MLSQNGIDYICQKFGNANFCCVNSGLSWYYTVEGTNYSETGATAQIVSRLASGLVTSLTMTNPARGTFTQTQLNTANQGTVTLQDAQTITLHDEPSEDQWCYSIVTCSDITNEIECLNSPGCYWCDGQCQSTPCGVICSDFTDQTTCEAADCFWYQKYFWEEPSCHSEEQNMLMDYLPLIIAGAGGVALIIIVKVLAKRSAPQPMYYPPMYPNQRR